MKKSENAARRNYSGNIPWSWLVNYLVILCYNFNYTCSKVSDCSNMIEKSPFFLLIKLANLGLLHPDIWNLDPELGAQPNDVQLTVTNVIGTLSIVTELQQVVID
jgi:hypothetical protein